MEQSFKSMYQKQVDANLALEDELHRARLSIAQLEAQRDFLLERLVDLEGDAWELYVHGSGLVDARGAGVGSSFPGNSSSSSAQGARKKPRFAPSQISAAGTVKPSIGQEGVSGAGASDGQEMDRTGLCTAALRSGKLCRRKALAGFQYCGYHLPLDPSSGFVYCAKPGKKCLNPVPANGDRLCKYHKPGGYVSGSDAQQEDQYGSSDESL